MKQRNYDIENLDKLVYVKNDIEANVIASMLNGYDIKTLLRYEGSSDFTKIIMGFSNLGVEIYVSKDDFEAAKEILNADFEKIND